MREPIDVDMPRIIIPLAVKYREEEQERDFTILKIKEALGIDRLEDNFDSIYLHALVHYAVDTTVPGLVHLFASGSLKQAFRDNLDKDEAKQKEFFSILEQEKATNRGLAGLSPEAGSEPAADLLPEVRRFRGLYEYFTRRTVTPFDLKKYNELREALELGLRRSYPYQAERCMVRLRRDFDKEFLEKKVYTGVKGDDGTGEKEPMVTHINRWLAEDESRLAVVLGEYGTGKSTFLRYIAHQLAFQRLEPGSAVEITDSKKRMPLLFPLREYEGDMESFIVTCFNREGILDIDFAAFKKRFDNGEVILMLDGFDEMTPDIDTDEKIKNFDWIRSLLDSSSRGKIILTMRQEYFRSEAEMQQVFHDYTKRGSGYQFFYLRLFDQEQVESYLASHTGNPGYSREKIRDIFDLQDLTKRPVLLQLIVDYLALWDKEKGEVITSSGLYRHLIDAEMGRTSKKFKFHLPAGKRLEILQKVAVWMFLNGKYSFDDVELDGKLSLRNYFETSRALEKEKYLNEFLTFTLLVRQGENRYCLSHESFRDYLSALDLMDEINRGEIKNFAKVRISGEVAEFMKDQVFAGEVLKKLFLPADLPCKYVWLRLLSEASGPVEDREPGHVGPNIAVILLRGDSSALKGEDLRFCDLNQVDFQGCDLSGTNFFGADLSGCRFDKSILSAGTLDHAKLENISLNLANENLKGIPGLSSLGKILQLDLTGNSIVDISNLQSLKDLQNLSLDYNNISDISTLKELGNLTRLSLSYNKIRDLSPLLELKKLEVLHLVGNPLDQEVIDRLRKRLPGCDIRF